MSELKIDNSEVTRMFDALTGDKLREAEVHSLHLLLTDLVEKASQNLISSVPNATKPIRPMKRGKSTYNTKGDSLLDAIRRNIEKISDGFKGTVHILGTKKDRNTGTWIARFFESGTNLRYHKNSGRYTGMIRPTHFFSSATATINSDVSSKLIKNLSDSIIKISEAR